MEQIITLKEAIRKSISQVFKNDMMGFMVKTELASVILAGIAFLPMMIAMFTFFVRNVPNLPEPTPSTMAPALTAGPNTFTTSEGEDENYLNVMPDSDLERMPTTDLGKMPTGMMSLPNAFEIVMFLVSIILFIVYIFAALPISMLAALHLANNTTEPVKDLLIKAFHKAPVLFLHMTLKGFILFFGYLFFFIPGVFLSIKFLFSEYVVLAENNGPVEALKRSSGLTKGYKLNLYLKSLGLSALQFLLFLPFVMFMIFIGNKSIGTVLGTAYYFILQLIFINFYLDLSRIKGAAATIAPEVIPTPPAPVAEPAPQA